MYPNMESKVNAQLAKTGTFFQSYIRRGLANLDAEANATSSGGSAASSISGLSGFTGSSASPTVRAREIVDAAARKRESVVSLASSDSSGVTDPSESYKDRLARLQQMFGYKSVGTLLQRVVFANVCANILAIRTEHILTMLSRFCSHCFCRSQRHRRQ